MKPATSHRQRVVIMTAKPEESRAVVQHLHHRGVEEVDGMVFSYGQTPLDSIGWDVFVLEVGAGNEEAAAYTVAAIKAVQPDLIFFVGVAGGYQKVRLGDVVIAEWVYPYESARVDDSGFHARPHAERASMRLVQYARLTAREDSWHSHPGPDAPRALVGALATGAKVVASSKSPEALLMKDHYNDVLAIEMEACGFHRAASLFSKQVEALVIRGISDLLDGKAQSDAHGSQDTASGNAASFTFAMLKHLASPGREATAREKPADSPDVLQGLGHQTHILSNGIYYYLPPLITVPATKFLMGSGDSDRTSFACERPQHWVSVAEYHAAKYPVTVAEYEQYLLASGAPEPLSWSSQRNYPSRPICGVSWNDSSRYIDWLCGVSGSSWRLLTEAEWELFARGPARNTFPWGNVWLEGLANTAEAALGGPSAVGSFLPGNGPYGGVDLCGNVREWTGSEFGSYPGSELSLRITGVMAVRGGCWAYGQDDCRCAAREGESAEVRSPTIGFRLARENYLGQN